MLTVFSSILQPASRLGLKQNLIPETLIKNCDLAIVSKEIT